MALAWADLYNMVVAAQVGAADKPLDGPRACEEVLRYGCRRNLTSVEIARQS
jgi:hypothetical protein